MSALHPVASTQCDAALSGVEVPPAQRQGRTCFSGGLLRARVWADDLPPNREAASLALPLGTSSGSCAALWLLLVGALATPA